MADALSSCCFIATVLYVWTDTNAFYEITKKILFFKKDCFEPYEKHLKATGVYVFFAEYLSTEDSFLSKLLSCPICISVWLCLFACLALDKPHLGVLFIFSNIIYFGFKKLILLLDE